VGGLSATERNWLRAVALVLVSIALFWTIQVAERLWRPAPRAHQLVADPVETSMRVLALPHFIIGLMFLLTSRGMRQPRSRRLLLLLAAAGAGFCWLFARIDGHRGQLGQLIVLFYFAIHEFRDEAHFYVANGDAPPGIDTKRLQRRVLLAPALIFGFAAAVVFLGIAIGFHDLSRFTGAVFGSVEPPVRWALGALPLLAFVLGVLWLARRGPPGAMRDLLRKDRPLVFVCIGIAAVILLEAILRQKSRALVTLHVTAWYVFVTYQMGRRRAPDPAPRRFSWEWMRSTRGGFATLHWGVAAIVLLACALAAYGFRNDPSQAWFQLLLSRDAFPYWTIMHITISFVPKP
jgi:hypothetical protein